MNSQHGLPIQCIHYSVKHLCHKYMMKTFERRLKNNVFLSNHSVCTCHRISAHILTSECFYSLIPSKEKLFSALSVQVWLKLEQHLVKNLSIMTDITTAIWFMVIRKKTFCSTTSILTEIRLLISWWCDTCDDIETIIMMFNSPLFQLQYITIQRMFVKSGLKLAIVFVID